MDFEELIITAKQLVEAHLSLSIGGAVLFAMFIFLALVKWRQKNKHSE